MGYYSELHAELNAGKKDPHLAKLLGITNDEFQEIEFDIVPKCDKDGGLQHYCVEIDLEKSPQKIVNKITNLENGCRVYLSANAFETDDSNYEEE